jgi:hypothetical protein
MCTISSSLFYSVKCREIIFVLVLDLVVRSNEAHSYIEVGYVFVERRTTARTESYLR